MNLARARRFASEAIVIAAVLAAVPPRVLEGQSREAAEPLRLTLTFRGAEREYFLHLPRQFARNKVYWPLVVVHGAGQHGRIPFPNAALARFVAESDLEAIVISPSFSNDDYNASRFPSLGEGEFLEEVLKDVRKDHAVRPKMLLTGYSRGGQFSHRYALAHPDRVAAVAPVAPGTWTTPDGRFLVQEIGEVRDVRAFLTDTTNASRVPANLRDLFGARVAAVAEERAVPNARDVPFLIMCGTLDPRLPIAREFARTLQALGYQVSVEWPRTPHGCDDMACWMEHRVEWEKYLRRTIEFFREYAERK
jgi:pimeloyl-ACP methyl ester carboxylesterase